MLRVVLLSMGPLLCRAFTGSTDFWTRNTNMDVDPPARAASEQSGPPIPALGTYHVQTQKKMCIGKGGFGCVFQGFHKDTCEFVAIKESHPQFARTDSFAKTLRDEYLILYRLQHPNIVRLYDFHYDKKEGQCAIYMEFVPGRTPHG